MPGNAKIFSINNMHNFYFGQFDKNNVRRIKGESTGYWPAYSMGFFTLQTMLQDITKTPDDIKNEFMKECFNNNGQIDWLFSLWEDEDSSNPFVLLESFEHIGAALAIEGKGGLTNVAFRIKQLRTYVYIMNLLRKALKAKGDEHFRLLNEYMKHVWSYRDTFIVHYYATARKWCNSYVLNAGHEEMHYANENATWKKDVVITRSNIDDAIAELKEETKYKQYTDQLEIINPEIGPPAKEVTRRYRRFRNQTKFYSGGCTVQVTSIVGTTRIGTEKIEVAEKITFDIPADMYMYIDGNTYEVELLVGDLAVSVSPRYPAWIDNRGTDLWGYSDNRSMDIYGSPRSTTWHMIGDTLTRYDVVERMDIETAVGAAYRVDAVNQRGLMMVYNQPQWLSFHRDRIFVPKTE